MSGTAEVTAAPAEFTLDGKTYRMGPLTDADYGELDQWLRTSIVRVARASLLPDDAQATREEVMDCAFRSARRMSWVRDGWREMNTHEGLARLLWQGTRRYHPDVTLAALTEAMLADETGLSAAVDVFFLLNPAGKKKQRAPTPETPSPT